MKKNSVFTILLLIAGVFFACSMPVHAQTELNFGVISTDASAAMKQAWQPFVDDLNKATGLKVKAFFASDYAGIIEAMRFNKVQFAWMGNKAAIEAVDRADGEVFAQLVYADGSLGYYSYLITNTDGAVKSLEDFLGNGKKYTFGNGDPNSTSGYLVPGFYVFAKNKIDPKSYFKTMTSASHGANLAAVLNKQVDVATNNSEEMEKLKANSPEKAAQIRILWTSPMIPSDPIVWRKDLPDETKKKIKDFVIAYGETEHGKDVMKAIYNYGGFRASSNAQLVPIRQLELFKNRVKVEDDTALSENERKSKLAELDKQLAALDAAK
jgi:phosphonate transport system substrate-binding protein